MVPHKSRDYREIFDISFRLRIVGFNIPYVNESTAYTVPDVSLSQLGSVLPQIIRAIAETEDDGIPIFFGKLDIKDECFRLVGELGAE